MNIFLTGASGFVGQALYTALLAQGHQLICALRPETVERNPGRWSDATPLPVPVLDPAADFGPGLSGADAVVHLAGMAHVRTRGKFELLDRFMVANCNATLNMARQAARAGAGRFVFLSSIGVNGTVSPAGHVFTETDPPRPDTAYGMSKRLAEEGLRKLAGETGMEIVILRPPLIFGPRAKANFLSLMALVHSGLPLPFAGVRNRKNFMGLGNLVDALILCLTHAGAGGQTFLVCDAETVSTPELIRKIAGAMDKNPLLFPFPGRLSRVMLAGVGKRRVYDQLWGDMVIDAGKIEQTLGWRPARSLDEEIEAAVRWYLDSSSGRRK